MALKFVNKPEQVDMPNLKDFERVVEHYNKKETDKIEGSKTAKFAVLLHEKIGRKWQERRAKDFAEDMLSKFFSVGCARHLKSQLFFLLQKCSVEGK